MVASRDWHVYGKTVWSSPKKVQKLFAQRDEDAEALLVYAVAWMLKSRSKLVADVVGHVPQEISRFVYFFLQYEGSVDAKVAFEKYRPSPIVKGGLEIILEATFKIDVSKRVIFSRLKELIEKNYELDYEEISEQPSAEIENQGTNFEDETEEVDITDAVILIDDEDD